MGGASYHLPGPSPWVSWVRSGSAGSGVHVSPLGNWSLTAAFLVDVNCPGSQEGLVSNWEPAHSLVEDALSGAEIAPHLSALAVACLPLCLQLVGVGLGVEGKPVPPCSAPHSLLVDMSLWAISPLGVVVRHVICGFFFLVVMFPSESPKLYTDTPVRGFPGVWKLLLLHDSLPWMGLHP